MAGLEEHADALTWTADDTAPSPAGRIVLWSAATGTALAAGATAVAWLLGTAHPAAPLRTTYLEGGAIPLLFGLVVGLVRTAERGQALRVEFEPAREPTRLRLLSERGQHTHELATLRRVRVVHTASGPGEAEATSIVFEFEHGRRRTRNGRFDEDLATRLTLLMPHIPVVVERHRVHYTAHRAADLTPDTGTVPAGPGGGATA